MWQRRRCTKASDESGAVAIIVALCLIAVMAMTMLTIDVGALLLRRRAMVNASDAAALAAAASCFGTDDSDVPEDEADRFAVTNSGGLQSYDGGIVPSKTRNCDTGRPGHVTVRYGQQEGLYFAPVLGFGDKADVGTLATASWGGAGAAPPMPMVINAGSLQGPCDVPHVAPGTTCYIWEDDDIYGTSAFGFLGVDQWDVDPASNVCNGVQDSILRDWIENSGSAASQHLNYPYATFVCTGGGNHSENQVYQAIRDLIGQTRDFPINGTSPADGKIQVDRQGNPCVSSLTNCAVDKYNIIGFAHLEIIDMLKPSSTAPINCTVTLSDTATPPVDLMALGRTQPCSSGTAIPAVATFAGNVTTQNPGTNQSALVVDSNGVVTSWARRPSKVSFDYTVPTTNCGGTPPPNASAHCLVVRWNGSSVSGGDPGGGADFGLGSVKLCELDYGSCSDQPITP
jgi:Flp pilus assembly protein TadG